MKAARLFLRSAAAILFFTAAAKVITSFGHGSILITRDPVTGFQFHDLLRGVGCVEAAVALVCVLSRRLWLSASLVAWLMMSFLVYRFGLVLVGYHRPCNCMGNLTDSLHLSPQSADNIMKGILTYLLIGSLAVLFWFWKAPFKARISTIDVVNAAKSGS
jgi:hypothetical protein